MNPFDFDAITDLQVGAGCMAADALMRGGLDKLSKPQTDAALDALDRKVKGSAKSHGLNDPVLVHSLRMGAAMGFYLRLGDHAERLAP